MGENMKIIFRHLTIGLLYKKFFSLLPAFFGTFSPIAFTTCILYGTIPMALLSFAYFGLTVGAITATIHLGSFLVIDIKIAYCCSIIIFVFLLLSWLIKTRLSNRKAQLKFINLYYSSRTALDFIGKLLCNQSMNIQITSNTVFYHLHIKYILAGKINYKRDKYKLINAISFDFKRISELFGQDVVLFGCSPGSFEKLLIQAGLDKSQFVVIKTVIPQQNARVLGLRRDFYLHIIRPGGLSAG